MVRAMHGQQQGRWRSRIAAGAATLWLAACGSVPGPARRDGPPPAPPPDVAQTPDAEPKVEPIRQGGPNKPYEVLGRGYTPETRDLPLREKGLASWYGKAFHGRRTASGEVYNMFAMTAAHKTMPLPSYARVRNPANGREILVRINDRGPFHKDRIVDLSYAAAVKLGVERGVAPVELERITYDDIRTGAWRRGATTDFAAVAPAALPAQAPELNNASDLPAPGSSNSAEVAAEPSGAAAVMPVANASPARALTAGARGWWVQLGAFRERGGAESFQQRVAGELDWLAPLLAVFSEAPLYRLQAGPYASRDEAQAAAQRVRETLQLVPLLVERR